MDHLAIMHKSWNLTQKILSGKKKIESRWYKSKCAPWNKIKKGETIYFKDSGESVAIKAKVAKIIQFSDLNSKKVKEILEKHGSELGIEKKDLLKFFKRFKNKKYSILIFLKKPQKIKPFKVDKTGFGIMSSWICVEDINKIKRLPKSN